MISLDLAVNGEACASMRGRNSTDKQYYRQTVLVSAHDVPPSTCLIRPATNVAQRRKSRLHSARLRIGRYPVNAVPQTV